MEDEAAREAFELNREVDTELNRRAVQEQVDNVQDKKVFVHHPIEDIYYHLYCASVAEVEGTDYELLMINDKTLKCESCGKLLRG